MRNAVSVFLVATTIAFTIPQAAHAGFFGGHEHHIKNAQKAKITFIEALKKAEEFQKGIIIRAELEDGENDTVYYEIDIVNGEDVYEIHVDAITGKVTFEKDDWFN